MALAALISATREAREPGVALRASFWLAGRTLVERQARLAAGASVPVPTYVVHGSATSARLHRRPFDDDIAL